MLIENNLWHGITVTNGDVHNECMYVNGGDRSVYRGNRFVGCPTMALFFTNWSGGAAYRDVVVENNAFGHTLDDDGAWHPSCAFKIGSGAGNQNRLDGWRVHYNTFETGACVDDLPGELEHLDRQPRRHRLRPRVYVPAQRRGDVRRPRRHQGRSRGQQPFGPESGAVLCRRTPRKLPLARGRRRDQPWRSGDVPEARW